MQEFKGGVRGIYTMGKLNYVILEEQKHVECGGIELIVAWMFLVRVMLRPHPPFLMCPTLLPLFRTIGPLNAYILIHRHCIYYKSYKSTYIFCFIGIPHK